MQHCKLDIKYYMLAINGNMSFMLHSHQEHPSIIGSISNQYEVYQTAFPLAQLGERRIVVSVFNSHPEVIGSNPTSHNSKLVAIFTILFLHEFLPQSQCAISITTFIGKGFEHLDLAPTFTLLCEINYFLSHRSNIVKCT